MNTKNIYYWMSALILSVTCLYSCSDKETLSVATSPTEDAFAFKASASDITLSETNASTHQAITLQWDSLAYGISTPVTFTIQMDSLNGDFSKPIEDEVATNKFATSYTDSVLNLKALKLKLTPNVAGKIKVRLKSNLAFSQMPAYSKVLTLNVTPYYAGTIFKYPMPSALYLQGGAVASNWSYPIPDNQKMVQIDDHRFALLVSLTGGGSFDFITSASAWSDPAYKAATSSEPSAGGNFLPSGSTSTPQWAGSDIITPATSGVYKVVADFITGTYTVTAAPSLLTAPTDLYIVGDATPMAWAAPDATQKFSKIDANTFKISIHLTAGKSYAFITAASTWSDPAYMLPIGSSASSYTSSGDIIESGAANSWGGVNMQSPATSGNYTITVNFKSGTYSVTQ